MRARSLTPLSNAWFGWGGGNVGAHAASTAAANRSASSAEGRKEVTTHHYSHDSAQHVNLLFCVRIPLRTQIWCSDERRTRTLADAGTALCDTHQPRPAVPDDGISRRSR